MLTEYLLHVIVNVILNSDLKATYCVQGKSTGSAGARYGGCLFCHGVMRIANDGPSVLQDIQYVRESVHACRLKTVIEQNHLEDQLDDNFREFLKEECSCCENGTECKIDDDKLLNNVDLKRVSIAASMKLLSKMHDQAFSRGDTLKPHAFIAEFDNMYKYCIDMLHVRLSIGRALFKILRTLCINTPVFKRRGEVFFRQIMGDDFAESYLDDNMSTGMIGDIVDQLFLKGPAFIDSLMTLTDNNPVSIIRINSRDIKSKGEAAAARKRNGNPQDTENQRNKRRRVDPNPADDVVEARETADNINTSGIQLLNTSSVVTVTEEVMITRSVTRSTNLVNGADLAGIRDTIQYTAEAFACLRKPVSSVAGAEEALGIFQNKISLVVEHLAKQPNSLSSNIVSYYEHMAITHMKSIGMYLLHTFNLWIGHVDLQPAEHFHVTVKRYFNNHGNNRYSAAPSAQFGTPDSDCFRMFQSHVFNKVSSECFNGYKGCVADCLEHDAEYEGLYGTARIDRSMNEL